VSTSGLCDPVYRGHIVLVFSALRIKFPSYERSHQRTHIMPHLNGQKGHHLVIVRYVKGLQ
jgi:hypothetical protein